MNQSAVRTESTIGEDDSSPAIPDEYRGIGLTQKEFDVVNLFTQAWNDFLELDSGTRRPMTDIQREMAKVIEDGYRVVGKRRHIINSALRHRSEYDQRK